MGLLQESFKDFIMRYVAAALLCSMGEQDITAENIEKILSSVGVEADKEKLKMVVAACKGKSTDDLVALGAPLLASMGGGGGSAAPAAAAAATEEAAPAAAAKKEEKKEESEEEDDDMGFGLFD